MVAAGEGGDRFTTGSVDRHPDVMAYGDLYHLWSVCSARQFNGCRCVVLLRGCGVGSDLHHHPDEQSTRRDPDDFRSPLTSSAQTTWQIRGVQRCALALMAIAFSARPRSCEVFKLLRGELQKSLSPLTVHRAARCFGQYTTWAGPRKIRP